MINISEGRRLDVITAVGAAAGDHLLDVHRDADHHRSVLTLAGPEVEDAARRVTAEAVARIDLRRHEGVHPRLGAADVVPFVPLAGSDLADARRARDGLADWVGDELGVPCFLYGPERSLPAVRRGAFTMLTPDTGPSGVHPTAGACAVGARGVLVAYNLWLATGTAAGQARAIARDLRGPAVRALALDVGGRAQVSCNLVEPLAVGPADAYDAVAALAAAAGTRVVGAELVGLLPAGVLEAVPPGRRRALDLDPTRTIEARLEQAGLGGSSRSGPRQ